MLEALCRQSSTTLDIMHAEDGPPITQRTLGLEGVHHSVGLAIEHLFCLALIAWAFVVETNRLAVTFSHLVTQQT
jgi:hypothetical protein